VNADARVVFGDDTHAKFAVIPSPQQRGRWMDESRHLIWTVIHALWHLRCTLN